MCTKNCCQIVHKVCVLILKTTDKIFIVKGKKKGGGESEQAPHERRHTDGT